MSNTAAADADPREAPGGLRAARRLDRVSAHLLAGQGSLSVPSSPVHLYNEMLSSCSAIQTNLQRCGQLVQSAEQSPELASCAGGDAQNSASALSDARVFLQQLADTVAKLQDSAYERLEQMKNNRSESSVSHSADLSQATNQFTAVVRKVNAQVANLAASAGRAATHGTRHAAAEELSETVQRLRELTSAFYERISAVERELQHSPVTNTEPSWLKIWEFMYDNHEYRRQLEKHFEHPIYRFRHRVDHSPEQLRNESNERIAHMFKARIADVRWLNTDPLKYFAFVESLFTEDASGAAKATIHLNMFGACILNLGTELHHKLYLERVNDFSLPGCFAMTELGHGSNVREIETRATYDPSTESFDLLSPTETSQKYWIGGALLKAKMAVVFARLVTLGEDHGVHAFLVRLRHDDSNDLAEGVRVADCGNKIGLHGIDNTRLWFDHVRVPRDHLLNRFCTVDADGTYASPIKNEGHRFLAHVGQLLAARVSAGVSAVNGLKVGLSVAIRYALSRKQFGPPGEKEQPIMNLSSHRRRLMPVLASTYAYIFFGNFCKEQVAAHPDGQNKAVHVFVSGFKALASWLCNDGLQQCRECCGGQGYVTRNLIGQLRCDFDIFVTLDGDNTVLLQMVAKAQLDNFKKLFRQWKGGYFDGILSYISTGARLLAQVDNPIVKRWSAPAHLRSAEFQQHALEYREYCLLRELAFRLRSLVRSGHSPFDAWNRCMRQAIALGRAHIERAVVDKFAEAVAQLPAGTPEHHALDTLRALYGLTILEKDSWFLLAGIVSRAKGSSVSLQVDALCDEAVRVAPSLVRALNIPEYILEQTIAGDWVEINSYANRHNTT